MGWVGHVSQIVTGQLERAPVAPSPGINGEPPTPSFIATCQKARSGPYQTWTKYRERCTGVVPWNLPGRAASVPVLGAALPLVSGLIPGGQEALGLLGLGGGMDGGFGGVDVGYGVKLGSGNACPPGTYCRGVPVQTPLGSTCIGSCVPLATYAEPSGGYTTTTPTGEVIPFVKQQLGKKKGRRRMNYSNQKALRRALRRATGYSRQQKAIKKLAAEFAREFGPKRSRPRRDVIVPRHTQVR